MNVIYVKTEACAAVLPSVFATMAAAKRNTTE